MGGLCLTSTPSWHLLLNVWKKGICEWTSARSEVFGVTKQKLCKALILPLLDFEKLFEVECDASGVGIGVVLTQPRSLWPTLVRNSMR